MSSESCRMLLRSKQGVELFSVPRNSEDEVQKATERTFLLKGSTTLQHSSPDGSRVYIHQPSQGVVMCPLNGDGENKVPFLEDSKGVQMLSSSPKGTYLLSWERLSSTDTEHKNLKIWDSKTGKFLYGFVQKNLRREGWPYVKWSHDEKYAFLMVTNEIRVYDGNGFGAEEVRFVDKMRCPGMSSFSVPPSSSIPSYLVSSFVPMTKDRPARASLHKYPSTVPPNASVYPSLLTKSLYQADEVTVHWSPKGDAALMALQTSVDTSGESYYGSTTLYLMTEEATDVVTVPLPKNSTGPVLDVAWMPNPGKPPCFAVISGRMPAMSSLHHGTSGEPIFLFGNASRNTISWAPHGRFVALAGFGNLAGSMTFWDRNKLKAIPQYDKATGVPLYPELVASCTVGFGWSPDSRCFFSCTTSPRMNVDNQAKLFRYNGEELTNVPWDNANYQPDKLLEAAFVPALPDVHEDRAQSPAPRVSGDAEAIAEAKRQASEAAKKPAVAAKKRYVPPSQRGKAGGTSLAERMRQEKEGNMMGATKVTPKPGIPGGSVGAGKAVPVGMASAAAGDGGKSKNALRRERQKENKAKAEAEAAAAAEAAKQQAATQQVDPEKRAKKINKQLRQIEDLKSKDPTTLNEDQQKKIDSEAELRAELEQLKL